MRKSVDFSNGVRGKHSKMNLEVLGAVEDTWAVCVTEEDKDLITLKLYHIETITRSGQVQVRVRNEKGRFSIYPENWFAPVEIPRKTRVLLDEVA
jgi:hypothetical protein